MAEINVERKRGMSPLVWILVLLVVAALAWLIYSMYVVEDTQEAPAPATTTTTTSALVPEEFVLAA